MKRAEKFKMIARKIKSAQTTSELSHIMDNLKYDGFHNLRPGAIVADIGETYAETAARLRRYSQDVDQEHGFADLFDAAEARWFELGA